MPPFATDTLIRPSSARTPAARPAAPRPAPGRTAPARRAPQPAEAIAPAPTAPYAHALAPTLGEQVSLAARRRQAAIAYVQGEDRFSWPEVDVAVDHLACGLLALGLKRGDRVGVLALNQIEWLLLFYAAARIGVAVVGLSVRYRDADLAHMLADSQTRAVFTLRHHEGYDLLKMLGRLQRDLPLLRHVVPIDGEGLHSLESLAATPIDITRLAYARRQVQPDDVAMVIYTSGTTGRPKGAGLTHRGMLATAAGQAAHLRITEDDLLHLSNPLSHVGGIGCGALSHLVGGGSVVLVSDCRTDKVVAQMVRHRPTIVAGVPTVLNALLTHDGLSRADLSGVRVVFCGGASVDPALMQRLSERMPRASVLGIYGLSETSGGVAMTPWNASGSHRPGAIGRLFEGWSCRVVDETGRPVPPGCTGELWLRGPGVMPAYIGAAAGQGFSADGWLMTGDMVEADATGFIVFKGRQKDMYVQGGLNVYPAETEALIVRHPSVLMAAIIGVPDEAMGEVGRAYVVPRPGTALRAADVRQWCADRLADYKVPREVVMRDSLPTTPAGKIQKAALRAGH